MKRMIFGIFVLLSLFIKSTAVQNRLLRLYFQTGEAGFLAISLVKFVIRLKRQKAYREAINRNNILNDNEKKYVNALLWRSSGLYKRAWKELENVQDNSERFQVIQVKTLYDLRDVLKIIKISDSVKVEKILTDKQQQTIEKHAYRKYGPAVARKICEIFAREESDQYFGQRATEYLKKEINYKQITKTIEDKSDEIFKTGNKEELVQWLNIFFELPEEESELAIILLLQKAENYDRAYSLIINHLGKLLEKGQIPLNISNSNWKLLALADYAFENEKFRLAYNLLIKAYKEGERSKLLYNLLIKTLCFVNLRKVDINNLQRLVDEGFIDLTNEDATELLGKSKNFYLLYTDLSIERIDKESLKNLLLRAESLDSQTIKSLYQNLIDELFDFNEKLPIDDEIIELFKVHLSNYYKFECVRGKYLIETDKVNQLESYILNYRDSNKLNLLMYLAKYAYENNYLQIGLELANRAYEISPKSPMVLRRLIGIHHRLGNISKRLQYLDELVLFSGKLFGREYDIASDEAKLLSEEWTWQTDSSPIELGDNIVHVLNKSLPEVNGYTIRSKEIIEHQFKMGLKPVVVTKLGWPLKKETENGHYEVHSDVRHYRLYEGDNKIQLNMVPLSEYFNHYAEKFAGLLRNIQPKLVHAASNFQNALPALMVAKELGVPTVYEVRGLWHDTTSSKIPGFENSERYTLHQNYELYCCRIANRVVAIGESLAEHLVSLGVDKSKISIVPNGVDAKSFYPQAPTEALIEKYDLRDKLVFGFIGSVTAYEGLDYLLKAIAKLSKERNDIQFLLVGDGPALPGLKVLAKELQLEDIVTFVGRVPHSQVKDFYSVIDAFPFPRTKSKVCELVTPLKPFEVMGMGKLAMVSNIPALNEMVIEGETGLIFESENVESLYECLRKVEEYTQLGLKSREWVEEHRDWDILINRYIDIYALEEVSCQSS